MVVLLRWAVAAAISATFATSSSDFANFDNDLVDRAGDTGRVYAHRQVAHGRLQKRRRRPASLLAMHSKARRQQYSTPEAPASIDPAPAAEAHHLRLCNAFAWPAPLEMRRLEEPKLVQYPLAYKQCHDYLLPLSEGDRLEFRAGDLDIGTFAIRGLPASDELLLLVPHRSDAKSMKVSFSSHIFAKSQNAQVAVVDTYTGPWESSVLLKDQGNQQELRFNSVVSLAPGEYAATLASADDAGLEVDESKEGKPLSFKVRPEENYVMLRVGNANSQDRQWPEDLLVFPQLSASEHGERSSASRVAVGALASLFLAAATLPLLG
mmetsp:Transcript_129587/g.276374  ORF Transcript_129587/g.276374 Transcript_129587/m.276374 type:complete len:322 (-) Transcript_129587:15-980(-)